MRRVLTTCPYCGVGCCFYLLVGADGTLVGVEPSSTHAVAQGQLCVKGQNAFQFVNHPDRLTEPMIRSDGRLRPASWDQALDLVVTRFRERRSKPRGAATPWLSSPRPRRPTRKIT